MFAFYFPVWICFVVLFYEFFWWKVFLRKSLKAIQILPVMTFCIRRISRFSSDVTYSHFWKCFPYFIVLCRLGTLQVNRSLTYNLYVLLIFIIDLMFLPISFLSDLISSLIHLISWSLRFHRSHRDYDYSDS